MTETPTESLRLAGGVTDAEAGALAQGVRAMANTIKGLREDLARVEKARAKWAALAAERETIITRLHRDLDDIINAADERTGAFTGEQS